MSEIFRPYPVFLKTTYGVILKYYIKSVLDEEKLRQSNLEWRTNGAEFAPRHSGGLDQPNGAKAAPSLSPNGAGINSVGLADPPLRSIWRGPEGEKEKLKTRLSELREEISELAKTVAGYDRLLQPYWYEKGDIEDDVRRTHGRRYDGAIDFAPDGAPARKPLFDALMELAIEWGPTKAERSQVQTRMKAFEREAKKIETELKYLEKKKGRQREQA